MSNQKQIQEIIKKISVRGRMAMAINCIKPILTFYKVNQNEKESLLNIFWQFVESDDLAKWDSDRRNCDILMGICDYIETDDRSRIPLGFCKVPRFALEIINKIDDIGVEELYGRITDYSSATHEYLLSILNLALANSFSIPPVEPFLRSPFTEKSGWGNSNPRDFFNY